MIQSKKQKAAQRFRVERTEVVFQGRIFRVTRETVVAAGNKMVAEVVRHSGSAVIVARRADGRVLLVRQFRLPLRRYLWEAAAGRLDAGETPLEGARRELQEETGFTASRWRLLARFHPSPGFMDEKMWLFLAEGLRPGPASPDPDEVIRHRWFTVSQLGEMVRRGKIQDGKTLLGYFFLRTRGR